MNKQELKQRIFDEQLPSSEAARLVDQLDETGCIHFMENKCTVQLGIEVCHNDPVLPFYEGLKTEPF